MPNLKELGSNLEATDKLIIDLSSRRMSLARLVALEKLRTKQKMYRSDIEDERLKSIRKYAKEKGINQHFAHGILYSLINESCKQQTILKESDDRDEADLETKSEGERLPILKKNLKDLTKKICKKYEKIYYGSKSTEVFFRNYEWGQINSFIAQMPCRKSAVDLGCGAGFSTSILSESFSDVKGFDISPDMVSVANKKHAREGVSFSCIDIDEGMVIPDQSVDFILANHGTASDFANIKNVIDLVSKSLKPGGYAFLSFYNSEALVYNFGYLPWHTSLSASVNQYSTNCLDVNYKGKSYTVYGKTYSISEIRSLLPESLVVRQASSFPTISSLFPVEVLQNEVGLMKLLEIDQELSKSKEDSFLGSYISIILEKR